MIMRIMKYFVSLWDECNGKKGISLQADAEEDPESNLYPSQDCEFPPKITERQTAGPDRLKTQNS